MTTDRVVLLRFIDPIPQLEPHCPYHIWLFPMHLGEISAIDRLSKKYRGEAERKGGMVQMNFEFLIQPVIRLIFIYLDPPSEQWYEWLAYRLIQLSVSPGEPYLSGSSQVDFAMVSRKRQKHTVRLHQVGVGEG